MTDIHCQQLRTRRRRLISNPNAMKFLYRLCMLYPPSSKNNSCIVRIKYQV